MTEVISPLSGRAYHRFDDRYWGAKPTLAPVIETVPPPNHDNNW